MRSKLFILLISLMIPACSMPTTTVRTVEERPGIIISGAPEDALLLVDGVLAGKASAYNGTPDMLTVEPGTHRIVVQQGGKALYDQQIFVDSEIKRINVR